MSFSHPRESGSFRVAITGIGMVTPCGPDRESSWQGLISGRSFLRWLTDQEHSQIGCDPNRLRLAGAPAMLPSVATRPPFEAMLFQAAEEAATDAGLMSSAGNRPYLDSLHDRFQTGLVIGTSKSSLAALRGFYLLQVAGLRGSLSHSGAVDAFIPEWQACWPSSPAASLAAAWEIRGPVLAPVAACATGMASICRGAELIRDGVCDLVFAGSLDDSISDLIWGSYRRLGVMARIQNDDPSTACRPFDTQRSGFLMGAGTAILVLERWESALARGVKPYAEWLGGATLSDSTALTQVAADAAGLTRLIQDLLRRARLSPQDLDYINLHGTGTRENDRYETQAIRQALGAEADRIPCSSLKGTIGHLLGGAGSVEFAATVLALRDGIIPPTCNLEHAAPECDLDYTPVHARFAPLKTAMKLSLGFGGHLVGGLIRKV